MNQAAAPRLAMKLAIVAADAPARVIADFAEKISKWPEEDLARWDALSDEEQLAQIRDWVSEMNHASRELLRVK